MVSKDIPTHELIASEEYWQYPPTNLHQKTSYTGTLLPNFRQFRDRKLIGEIAERVLDMSGGFDSTPVEIGQRLPILSKDSSQVLRIVHDWRRINTLGLRRSRAAKLKKFDIRADEMLARTLYDGEDAQVTVPHSNLFSTAVVRRNVLYARADSSGDQLAAIKSVNFFDISNDDRYISLGVYRLRQLKVGEPYYYNMFDNWLGKIALAEILEPHGTVRADSHNRKRKKQRAASDEDYWPAAAKPSLSQ